MNSFAEGAFLWQPTATRIEQAQLTRFRRWLELQRSLHFADYDALQRWSVADKEVFWRALWDYFEVIADGNFERALIMDNGDMSSARWFEGTRTNYAEHLLRHEALAAPGAVALSHSSETRAPATTSWQELGNQVRVLATRLRAMGIKPGDRIVSYMPNVPETAVAMLATTAIGAIWSSAAPEFGARTVIERFGQIEPKLLFAADGYSFNGKLFDRRREVADIANGLPTVETIVWLDYTGLPQVIETQKPTLPFTDLLQGPAVARDKFQFERVPSDHPLWVLYSSGTTGLPKAIVHGHAGMIAEHLKFMGLQCDLGPDKRVFFYSTTGWMMWNFVLASLITGASAVLYDGSPTHGGAGMLWRMTADSGTTMFGASPTLVHTMKKAGIEPGALFDLSRLDSVLLGGAPSTPETFQWFYDNVKADLWVSSPSGGTELCSGLVGGVVTQPVYAGEIQARLLGLDVQVWDDDGHEIIDQIGELVVTGPFPSAPLFFWNDVDNVRYRESYYSTFPGIWRHGDLAKINQRGGVYVYGRSDSTLNRFGVRIGTAEIYRILEQVPGVADSLVICCETPDGGFYMPLFVALQGDDSLTDELKTTIVSALRKEASPRHVPDEIHVAPGIPYTLTGKKMEVPIRKLVMGYPPEKAASRDAMANPALLDWYIDFAHRADVAANRQRKAT